MDDGMMWCCCFVVLCVLQLTDSFHRIIIGGCIFRFDWGGRIAASTIGSAGGHEDGREKRRGEGSGGEGKTRTGHKRN